MIKHLIAGILFTFSFITVNAQKTVPIIELNSQSFKQKVWDFDKNTSFTRQGNLPIILDFHAVWCGPCKKMAPHLQVLQNKYKGKIIIYKIDVDQNPKLAELFGIEAMPTLIFINSKKSYQKNVGYLNFEQLETLTQKAFFQSKPSKSSVK